MQRGNGGNRGQAYDANISLLELENNQRLVLIILN